jgi:hypothetical protein
MANGIQIANVSYTVNDLVGIISCGPISNVYDEAVNQSICDSFYNGIFVMCITHFLTAGCLYFILMVVSLFHNIYAATDADGDDSDDYRGSYEPEFEMGNVAVTGVTPHEYDDSNKGVETSKDVVKGAYWEDRNQK